MPVTQQQRITREGRWGGIARGELRRSSWQPTCSGVAIMLYGGRWRT